MIRRESLPKGFLAFREEGNRAFGCAHFDAGVEVQRCPSCGAESTGALVRYPEAIHREVATLLDGARRAASTALKRRAPCAQCATTVPARGRHFVYAHYAGRLGSDLLLVLRPSAGPFRVTAYLVGAEGETRELEVPSGLDEIAGELFHPSIVRFREAYAAVSVTNEPERALALLAETLEHDPRFVAAHSLMADVLLGYGRIGDAVPHIDAAIALDPSDPEANLLKGRLEIAFGSPGRARPYLELAVKSPRTASGALYRLGLIAEDGGSPGEARRHYENALEVDPENEGAQDRLEGLERGIEWRFFRSDREA